MPLFLCTGRPFDVGEPCIRESWSAFLPAGIVFVLCFVTIAPLPKWQCIETIPSLFKSFITLEEAGALSAPTKVYRRDADVYPPSKIRSSVLFSGVTLVQTLLWGSLAAFRLVSESQNIVLPFVCALSWASLSVLAAFHSRPTPSWPIVFLTTAELLTSIVLVGGIAFDALVYGTPPPHTLELTVVVANWSLSMLLAVLIARMPLAIPNENIDPADIGSIVSPEDYTVFWRWLTFAWVRPLVTKGTYSTLKEKDVWPLSVTMQSRPLLHKWTAIKTTSLVHQLFAANSLDLILDGVLSISTVFLAYTGPWCLKNILDSIIEGTPESKAHAALYSLLAFAVSILKSQVSLHHLWFGRRADTRMRQELVSSMYVKALKRVDVSGATKAGSDDSEGPADVGKVVNLMSSDAIMVSETATHLFWIYNAPVEIAIGTWFLYKLLGVAAFSGILVLVGLFPVNKKLMAYVKKIRIEAMSAKDKRMSVVNELVSAVKFIKYFGWELKWIERALATREVELGLILRARIANLAFLACYVLGPILVSGIAFTTFVVRGNELTVSVAFTSLTIFAMIAEPLSALPSDVMKVIESLVAVGRLTSFFQEDEVSAQVSSLKEDECIPSNSGFGLDKASFTWNQSSAMEKEDDTKSIRSSTSGSSAFQLRDITVAFPEGKISVISGETASGKTALLLALLGEMTSLPGGRINMSKDTSRVDSNGLKHSISYAAQAPWLRHQSIRDNILFGAPFEQTRYDAVVVACALKPDFAALEDGDSTEIGVRGVSLSGGQKARVALARAVYARTKYVLLDDVFSAVDSHTSKFLYDRLFCGPLFEDRTVVLVTHHVGLVTSTSEGAFYLLRMSNGRVEHQGLVTDLRSQGVLSEIKREEEEHASPAPIEHEQPMAQKTPNVARKLVENEVVIEGAVGWHVYRTYIRASSWWTWIFLAILIVLADLLGVSEKLWIKIWGNAYNIPASAGVWNQAQTPLFSHIRSARSPSSWPSASESPLLYVAVYAAIGVAGGLVRLVSNTAQFLGSIRASRVLFEQLLHGVVRATMRWHDCTPQGRMLNRFGKDIETIDSSLAENLNSVSRAASTFLVSVLTISFVSPSFLLPATVLAAAYYYLAIGYLNAGRDLRRLDATTRSKIFEGFSELLEGIVTVRAFSTERSFLDESYKTLDTNTKLWYAFWMSNRWLLLNYELLSAIALLITSLLCLNVDAGLAGLCISTAMGFTMNTYWLCRFYTALELDLNSVERIAEYLDLPQEPPAIIIGNRPPAYWPSSSANDSMLVVEDLVIGYAPELPAVLQGVSFTLKAGERVAILGRTGSGKSTLSQSLLRFVDPRSGRILIDGIDITTIGLDDLRSKITFLPQEATLFTGTLRDNLDPFGDHDDFECLDALLRVHVISQAAYDAQRATTNPSVHESIFVNEISTGDETSITLGTQVAMGGSNFSQGQRQLLALARALLRRSSIVILDEASSSLDHGTDEKIQSAIREEFQGSLLLTVAHRISTVIDYDRVIVLDKGKVVEFDTPHNLIQKTSGMFRSMCIQTGSIRELEEAAFAAVKR